MENINKIINKNTRYNNNGDVVYGDKNEINVNLFDSEQLFKLLTNKDNYLKFYKQYISYFDELEGYAMSLLYPNCNDKKYEFSSNILIFGKKIIDWIFGAGYFPKNELKEFYDKIKIDFDFDDNTFIVRRWKANSAYFNSDLKSANENYSELFDELCKNANVPDWYLDDICIDGRNILNQYNNQFNKIQYENKYQNRFKDNKHNISYPGVDRIKVEIYEKVFDNTFNNKNKSKYTTIWSSDLEICLNKIQDLIYLTIFYGSITHLKLARKLIANMTYMYADEYKNDEFYELTLKMLFLSGELKKYKELYNKLKLEYSFVNSESFIKELLDSKKVLFLFEQDSRDIFIFNVYGRYLNDNDYIDVEDKVINIINREFLNINNVYNALKSIIRNIKRISRLDELLDIMLDYIKKGYVRYYDEIVEILDVIDIVKLSNKEFIKYQDIVDLLLDNKDKIGCSLSNIIINIKDRDVSIAKYDKYINIKGSSTNISYRINNCEGLEGVKIIVDIYREKHEERENSIGYASNAYEYFIGRYIFEEEMFNDEVREFMISDYFPLAKDILMSSREILYEKIKYIRYLGYLYMALKEDKDIKNDIIDIVHKCRNEKYYDLDSIDIFRIKDEIDFDINIMMFDVMIGVKSFNDVLNKYLVICADGISNMEEVLDCINILGEYGYCYDENIIDKLFILFNMCYKVCDIDIRNKIVNLSKVFIGTRYQEEVIGILEDRVDDMVFEECKGYIELISSVNGNDRRVFDDVIDKLKRNRCFDVRWMVERYCE